MSVVLRDYQDEAVEALRAGCATNTSQIVVMATGMGKTVVAAEFMKRWDTPGDILFLAHRRELLDQTTKVYERLTGEHAYLEMAECKAPDLPMWGTRRVVVASVQTLIKRLHLERFAPDRFSLIVVDEAHRSVTQSHMKVLQHFGILEIIEASPGAKNFQIVPVDRAHCRCVGLTATPRRTDEEALNNIYGALAYQMDIWEGIQKGWLVCPDQDAIVVNDLDLSSIKCRKDESGEIDFSQTELDELMSEEGPLHEVADSTLREIGKRQAIIFAAGVNHAKLLEEVLNRRRKGVASAVYGSMDGEHRKRITADFKSGQLQILVNVFCLVEGFDAPAAAVVVMARPTKSLLVYTQMLGRVTRPLPGVVDGLATPEERKAAIAASGKPSSYVLDFVGNSDHKLVTTADILGGKHDVRVVDRAKQILNAKGGGNVEEALKEATEQIGKEICRELKKKNFAPQALYDRFSVPIFDVGGASIPQSKVDTSSGSATEMQVKALVKMGVSKEMALRYGKKQAGAILMSLREKRCSNPQAYQLRKFGYDPSAFNFKQASEKLDQLLTKREAVK